MTLHKLTAADMTKLKTQLANDRAAVLASPTIDNPTQQSIVKTLDELSKNLDKEIQQTTGSDASTLFAGWAVSMSGSFQALAKQLNTTLLTPMGACTYDDGNGNPACAVMTQAQCDALGGTFAGGVDCSENPLV